MDLSIITSAPFSPRADYDFNFGAIATTEVCDLSCVFCHFNGPQSNRKIKTLSVTLVQKVLSELPIGTEVYFAATGEFFLDPNALTHLSAAITRNLNPLVLSHGNAFSRALIDKLLEIGIHRFRISCDAIDHDSYRKIRRGGGL